MSGAPLLKPARRGPKPRKPIKRSSKPIERRSRPAAVRRTSSGQKKHAADLAWSKAVRAKGPCVAIGNVQVREVDGMSTSAIHSRCYGQMEAAHIISRRYAATRTDIDNGLPLCHGAHSFFTENPSAWVEFVQEKIGDEKYEALRRKALAGPKEVSNG